MSAEVSNNVVTYSLIFVALCAVNMILPQSAISDSFYFIKEHLYVIALLLLLRPYLTNSVHLIIVYGVIAYKIELILFNVFLPFCSEYLIYSHKIILSLLVSLWVILLAILIIRKS